MNGSEEYRGFLSHQLDKSWFCTVPLFVLLQRLIEPESQYKQYIYRLKVIAEEQEQKLYVELLENELKKMAPAKNFTVVPLMSLKRKYVRIDTKVLLGLMIKLNIQPKHSNGKKFTESKSDFAIFNGDDNAYRHFNQVFKINKMFQKNSKIDSNENKKKFASQLVTDGVSVCILQKKIGQPNDNDKNSKDDTRIKMTQKEIHKKLQNDIEQIKKECNGEKPHYFIGIDPGYNTWLAAVRRTISTGKEALIKISSKQYYGRSKQHIRDKLAKKYTDDYTKIEKEDLINNNMPSPKGRDYEDYIRHRLRMMNRGLEVYTTRKYARLSFDKYIESYRAIDTITHRLTRGKRTIVFLGAAEFASNAPIKTYKRCPGTRKIIQSFSKQLKTTIVYTDEYMTSQVCPLCLKRFGDETKRNRLKVCFNCNEKKMLTDPASIIVTKISKKTSEQMRKTKIKTRSTTKWIYKTTGNCFGFILVCRITNSF